MHILILGAGYAGLRVALELDRMLQDEAEHLQVSLVDQNPYHQDICLLHLAATAAIADDNVAIPLPEIFHQRSIQLYQGKIAQIDTAHQQVVFTDEQVLPYDMLVVALGAETNYVRVPGAAEHTYSLRSYTEALRLRATMQERFREAAQTSDQRMRRILLTVAVVGGGFTGCQLVGELAAWLPALARESGVPRSEVRIAMVEGTELLLSEFGPWATREVEAFFDKRGVSVYLNTTVEAVEAGTLFVSGERMLRAGTLVWAVGIRAPALLAASGLPTDAQGRVLVDRTLQVEGHEGHIFALGDCAHIPDEAGGGVPATASYAVRQGAYLATALRERMQGNPVRPYEPLHLGQIVSLGPDYAVGNPLGVRTSGTPAALLKQGIEQWYQATIRRR
jgi:NADH dehydrogenase